MQAERDAIEIEDEEQVSEYAELQQQEAESRSLVRSMVMQPRYALPFLQPGRLARVLTTTESAPASTDDTDAAHEVSPLHCCCLLLCTHASTCIPFSSYSHSCWCTSAVYARSGALHVSQLCCFRALSKFCAIDLDPQLADIFEESSYSLYPAALSLHCFGTPPLRRAAHTCLCLRP